MISNVDNKKIILSTKLKEPLKRNENIKEEDISYIQQVSLINQLYMDINTNTKNDITSVIVRELDRKLSGYKQQDIKKEIYDEHFFITYDDIVEMLVVSKLKCHYCQQNQFTNLFHILGLMKHGIFSKKSIGYQRKYR